MEGIFGQHTQKESISHFPDPYQYKLRFGALWDSSGKVESALLIFTGHTFKNLGALFQRRCVAMPFPSPADDYQERILHLDDLIVHPSATFFIRISSLAMESTFHQGDILIIDRALPPLDYRTVLVVYKGRYYVRRIITEDERIILRADNPSFVDIVVSPDEIELWGVVTYAIHKDSAPTRKLPRRVK